MAITRLLGHYHVTPAAMQRRLAQVVAVVTVLCLATGCDNPLAAEFGEPDEATQRDFQKCGLEKPKPGLAAPPGSYVDQGLLIDYARIGRDNRYVDQILADPRMFEQVYADAALGNLTARWSLCLFEASSRGTGRRGAQKLAGLRCQTIARCTFHPDKLPYSDATASGIRVLTLIADSFEAEARRLQVTQEIIGHVLTLFVGTRVLGARVRAGPATVSRPTGARLAGKRPVDQQIASPPAMRALTREELTRVHGGIPTQPGPVAAGLAKAVSKPVYRSFTRANFRHNLAQRTGGIPENAQAHHVLPVKFEPQCRKAGINIHNPKFGTWWKRRDHLKTARAYNDRWKQFFRHPNRTSEEILQFGRELAKDYGLAIGF